MRQRAIGGQGKGQSALDEGCAVTYACTMLRRFQCVTASVLPPALFPLGKVVESGNQEIKNTRQGFVAGFVVHQVAKQDTVAALAPAVIAPLLAAVPKLSLDATHSNRKWDILLDLERDLP
ncbi:hypothetical protein GX586_03695 [bacterium]|nr:hypothetical protein [bacterium]